ncbi:MAG: hypothetical protein EOP92_01305 [Lysobacteraceae bacterium]|nr:MAG: hypothetical protein EOP92_01305 [Xanthomonadaceae bacterium]
MKLKLLALLPLLWVVAAHAQTSPPSVDKSLSSAPATAERIDEAGKAEGKESLADRNCLKHTGSRIKPRADKQGRKCISANGRSYSKEDLDRTGEADLAEALRRLDPAIR